MMSIYFPSKHAQVIPYDLQSFSGEQPTKTKKQVEIKALIGE
jgi:hypothetical protein